MPPNLVLAVDLGSSWCKAAYVDRRGTIVSEGRVTTRSIIEYTDNVLECFWQAIVSAIQLANLSLPENFTPEAIGVSCRGLFGICLDGEGKGFIPSYDDFSMKASVDTSKVYRSDAWGAEDPYAFGYAARVAGMVSDLRNSSPHEWRQIEKIGSLHDYVVYRLSGEWVTDPASGPNMLHWPAGLMELSGLPLGAFPEIKYPWQIAEGLSKPAALALGIPANTRVVVGLHDGAAANLGTGAVNPGDACLTLGTNFALRVVTGKRPRTNCFGYVVAPGQWAWVNSLSKAATELDIVADTLLGAPISIGEKHRLLGKLAVNVNPARLSPIFMTGKGATVPTTAILAAIKQGFSLGEIYQSALQAAAAGVCQLARSAQRDGAPVARWVATGGGVLNERLLQTIVEMLGRPLQIGPADAGILGAGMVAGIGAGWYPTLDDAWESIAWCPVTMYPEHMKAGAIKGRAYL